MHSTILSPSPPLAGTLPLLHVLSAFSDGLLSLVTPQTVITDPHTEAGFRNGAGLKSDNFGLG